MSDKKEKTFKNETIKVSKMIKVNTQETQNLEAHKRI